MTWIIFLLCVLAALADVLGGLLTVFNFKQKQLQIIIGLGAGFLLRATVLDRLPESIMELPNEAPLLIVIGYLTLLYFDHPSTHKHGNREDKRKSIHIHSTTIKLTFITLLFHAFMDGVIIAGAFLISRSVGILVFIAITLHKILEGFNVASISMFSGQTRKRAFFTSVGLALSTLLGAMITILPLDQDFSFEPDGVARKG